MKKKIKVIFYLIALVLIIVGGYNVFHYFSQTKKEVETISIPSFEKEKSKSKIISKKMIIENLKNTPELVGLTAKTKKTYTYMDEENAFKVSENENGIVKWAKNTYNKTQRRKFEINIEIESKLGFDLDKLKEEQIIVNNEKGEVKVISPKIKIIALVINYDEAKIEKEIGIFREEFSEEDRQKIFKFVRKKAEKEIQMNKEINEKALKETQKTLESIIELTPNVKKVKFINL